MLTLSPDTVVFCLDSHLEADFRLKVSGPSSHCLQENVDNIKSALQAWEDTIVGIGANKWDIPAVDRLELIVERIVCHANGLSSEVIESSIRDMAVYIEAIRNGELILDCHVVLRFLDWRYVLGDLVEDLSSITK